MQILTSCILSGKWKRSWQNQSKDSEKTENCWLAYNQVILTKNGLTPLNKIIFSFRVNMLDFNLYLGLEANSSAGPESELAFQVVVLECKVLLLIFNVILNVENSMSQNWHSKLLCLSVRCLFQYHLYHLHYRGCCRFHHRCHHHRTFLTQTVAGLASFPPPPTPMWGSTCF